MSQRQGQRTDASALEKKEGKLSFFAAWVSSLPEKGMIGVKGALARLAYGGASPERWRQIGRECVYGAVNAGDLARLKKAMLIYPIESFEAAGKGATPLMVAAMRGDTECVRELLKICPADTQNGFGQTALRFAVEKGHCECVRELLPYSNIDFASCDRPILMVALLNQRASFGMVEVLLTKADPNQSSPNQKMTALMTAASQGNEDVVRALLKVCDPTMRDKEGRDAAYHANMHGHFSVAEQIRAQLAIVERSAINKEIQGVGPVEPASKKKGARL